MEEEGREQEGREQEGREQEGRERGLTAGQRCEGESAQRVDPNGIGKPIRRQRREGGREGGAEGGGGGNDRAQQISRGAEGAACQLA